MKLWRIAAALAGTQVLVGLAMAAAPDSEGWFGGLAFAAIYAAPMLLMALALRSPRLGWHTAAAWAALAFGAFYTAVVVGNWTGYTNSQAIAAVLLTAPTVALDALIFWSEVVVPRTSRAGSQERAATTGR